MITGYQPRLTVASDPAVENYLSDLNDFSEYQREIVMDVIARDIEPSWLDEKDWLRVIEFLPTNDRESRELGAEAIGYLFGYAHLTGTRVLALIGDPKAEAYELLFSFSSVEKATLIPRLLNDY